MKDGYGWALTPISGEEFSKQMKIRLDAEAKASSREAKHAKAKKTNHKAKRTQ